MGSLTSRPQVSTGTTAITQPVTYTQSTAADDNAQTQTTTADSAADTREARALSLLSRDRGRLGTILTGFRGLLSQSAQNTGRKTLLGE